MSRSFDRESVAEVCNFCFVAIVVAGFLFERVLFRAGSFSTFLSKQRLLADILSTMERPTKIHRTWDGVYAAIWACAVFTVCFFLQKERDLTKSVATSLGQVSYAEGSVFKKIDGQAYWQSLYRDAKITEGDQLRSSSIGLATIKFGDNANLHFGANTEFEIRGVYVENEPSAILVKLKSGNLQVVVRECKQCVSIFVSDQKQSFEVRPGEGRNFQKLAGRGLVASMSLALLLDDPQLFVSSSQVALAADGAAREGVIQTRINPLFATYSDPRLLRIVDFDLFKFFTTDPKRMAKYHPYVEVLPVEGVFYFKQNKVIAFHNLANRHMANDNAALLQAEFVFQGYSEKFQTVKFRSFADVKQAFSPGGRFSHETVFVLQGRELVKAGVYIQQLQNQKGTFVVNDPLLVFIDPNSIRQGA